MCVCVCVRGKGFEFPRNWEYNNEKVRRCIRSHRAYGVGEWGGTVGKGRKKQQIKEVNLPS